MPAKRPRTNRQRLPDVTASEPEARLVCAVLELAVNDARSRDVALAAEARRWLLRGDGRHWLAWLDLDAGRVVDWCRRLPPPGQRVAA